MNSATNFVVLNPTATGPLEVRFYAIDPSKRKEFLDYYRSTIMPWLEVHGIDDTDLSLIESRTSLQLVFAAPQESPPWDTLIDFPSFLLEAKIVSV